MSKFYLKKIKRIMFVIVNKELFFAPSNLRCAHDEWFRKEGWMNDENNSFMEKNPRGFIDSEGIYLYQGHKAYCPKISKILLKKILKKMQKKLNLNDDLHVYFGTIQNTQINYGKLPPQKDIGSISEIFKNFRN